LTPSFHPNIGGAETYTRCLVEALAARGHDVAIATCPHPGAASNERVGGVDVRRGGPSARAGWLLPQSARALESLVERPPEIILAEFEAVVPAKRLARKFGVPLAALVHDVTTLSARVRCRGVFRGMARYMLHERMLSLVRPDLVVAVSNTTVSVARRLVRAPMVVALSGADHVQEGPDPDPESLQVLFMSRLVRGKGLRDAVQAVHRVERRVPGVRLLVLGDGPERRHVPSWVRVLPSLPNRSEELDRIVRSSAVLVLPSLCEGAPLALVEAAARGVPYAAYDIPGIRERHKILAGGLLVPRGDVEALCRALVRLLVDRTFRSRLAHAGRDRSRRHLRWAETATTVERAFSLAVAGRIPTPGPGTEA
jgi:glycosyltransferase involved in cell wall biosynthesis